MSDAAAGRLPPPAPAKIQVASIALNLFFFFFSAEKFTRQWEVKLMRPAHFPPATGVWKREDLGQPSRRVGGPEVGPIPSPVRPGLWSC